MLPDLKNATDQQPHELMECDNDINGHQVHITASNNEGEKSPTRDTSAFAVTQNEIEPAGTDQTDDCDANEFHKDKSDIRDSQELVTVVAMDSDGDVLDSAPAQEVESDSIPSPVTSSITITTNGSLLVQTDSTTQSKLYS